MTNSDFEAGRCYWDLFRKVASWKSARRPIVILDLTSCVHLKPYAIAILVAACRELASADLSVRWPADQTARDHLCRIGMPEAIGVEAPAVAVRGTNVPVRVLADRPAPEFTTRLVELLESEYGSALWTGLAPRMADCIEEMILNACTHGDWASGCVVVGQSFPRTQCVEAVILDLGQTIRDHLQRAHSHIVLDEQAIEFAVLRGTTGTIDRNRYGEPNSGYGLFTAREFVETIDGQLAILSGDSLVCYGRSRTAENLRNARFPGTLINIRFNTDPTRIGQSRPMQYV